MSILSKVFNSGEHEIFIRTSSIPKIAMKANDNLKKVIDGSNDLGRLRSLQDESSKEMFSISSAITSGSIAPNIIDNMLSLVGSEEEITDSIFNLSRQMVRHRLKEKEHKEYVNRNMSKMNELAGKAIRYLYQMHFSPDIDEIKRLRSEIKLLEHEGDRIKESMLDFTYSSAKDFKSFYHMIHLARMSDDILDACEDSSDTMMSIMLSITT